MEPYSIQEVYTPAYALDLNVFKVFCSIVMSVLEELRLDGSPSEADGSRTSGSCKSTELFSCQIDRPIRLSKERDCS